MRELPETIDAVIATHATCPRAAKRQLVTRHMYDNIVNGHAASDYIVEELCPMLFVIPEVVEGQRAIMGVNVFGYFVNLFLALDGQQRTEYFFAHHG